MIFDEFAARYGLADKHKTQLDDDTRFCAEWLEFQGCRFGVEFGYQNAKEVARKVALERIGKRRLDGR